MFAEVQAFLKSNPILAGGAGMAVMGWAVMQAKSLPLKAWKTLQDQFSTTITVYSEDTAYRMLNVWLSQHPSAKHARRFGVTSWYNARKDQDDFMLTPGEGFHLLRDGWRPYLLHRTIEQAQGSVYATTERKQTISITTFGRSGAPLKKLLAGVMAVREDHDTIPVHIFGSGGYTMMQRRAKRPLDTVYINPTLKAEIVGDVQRFLGRRTWYAERAIPYRRGYCLEGPPGTGKTTLIFALASLLEKPVFLINPAALDNDSQLQMAINGAGAGIVVIEDIDTLKVSKSRRVKVKPAAAQSTPQVTTPGAPSVMGEAGSDNSKSGITLSGLLNAVDGMGALDGRLLFMTSNHADTLDPALMRPGRIDRRFYLDHAGQTEAEAMYRRFFPDSPVENLPNDIRKALPISQADLQNRLLGLAEAA